MHRMRRVGGPPRSAVPLFVLAVVLVVVAAFFMDGGVARIVIGLGAVCALTAALLRWKRAADLMGGGPEDFGDPEEYRREFGDSIVDARTRVDPQIGIMPIDTTHDH
jgi:hypothetical protein